LGIIIIVLVVIIVLNIKNVVLIINTTEAAILSGVGEDIRGSQRSLGRGGSRVAANVNTALGMKWEACHKATGEAFGPALVVGD
jgi:hypothetical protein